MGQVYCGIDWAENHHDVALVDAEGNLVAKRRIADSVAGFAELTAMLAVAGDSEEVQIPVAIETSRGLLVAALRATGRPVYPINPMAVARYRERHSVPQKKSDHVDAMTLANILRTDARRHRPLSRQFERLCWRSGTARNRICHVNDTIVGNGHPMSSGRNGQSLWIPPWCGANTVRVA